MHFVGSYYIGISQSAVQKHKIYKPTLIAAPEECTSYLHGHGSLKSRIAVYVLKVIIQ